MNESTSRDLDSMAKRVAPKSSGSFAESWDGQDMPSYMSPTSPIHQGAEFDSALNVPTKISHKVKRRRPAVVQTRSSNNAVSKLCSKLVNGKVSSYAALLTAVFLWYILGVLSIGTTKLLLNQGVPPLYLTLQQLFLGSNFLRLLLHFKALGSAGLTPWPEKTSISPIRRMQHQQKQTMSQSLLDWHLRDLILSGIYFALGFASTNLSFSGASAAFVETVKAAEPITSAATAVLWGIEVLSAEEASSLVTIVAGVVLSTLGNSNSGGDQATSLSDSIRSSVTVMFANLCFSFRGLHQKLFRATPHGSKVSVDDLNLQFRMQQVGVMLLASPVVFWDSRILLSQFSIPSLEFIGLAVLNGLAFTSYNLASTFVLTRISVVHHAALNCIRRIFAIIVTSIAFRIPITIVGALGILVSVAGFMSFTHFKVKRQHQPKPISTLLPISAAQSNL